MPKSIAIIGRSDVGRVRRRNEDAFTVLPELGIAVVADGMGGHPGGDVASRIAAETAARVLADAVEDGAADLGGDGFVERFLGVMEGAVLRAHGQIRKLVREKPHLDGMGTTLTAMVAHAASARWVLGHVGDSRAYRFRNGELDQLTRDDTWVQEQIDLGEMQPESARLSPYAHLLTQGVGLEEDPAPQLLDGSSAPGDLFLLCTDGLVGMVDDGRIAAVLAGGTSNRSAGEGERLDALVEAANEAGGHDNITAALVRFG